MNQFPGIVSLFIACIELVLLINIIVFSEKNKTNKLIIAIVSLLFGYQSMEFFICYSACTAPIAVYSAFVIITFLPPLLLTLVFTIKQNKTDKTITLIFLPAVFLLSYYLFVIPNFVVTECTVLFAAYDMPLGDLYGVVYYSPIIISVILLLKMLYNPNYEKEKTNLIIILSGILSAFVPVALIIAAFPNLIDYVESFFCKSASLIAITLSIVAIRNKEKLKETKNAE
jgi:hypothetical protein